jgi:hypothetical protein
MISSHAFGFDRKPQTEPSTEGERNRIVTGAVTAVAAL